MSEKHPTLTTLPQTGTRTTFGRLIPVIPTWRAAVGSRKLHGLGWLGALTLLLSACGELSSPETMERELFVEAYVELRTAALTSPDAELSDSARAAVLERIGVSEDDLMTFVEVRSEDLGFMRSVWDEIEQHLDYEMDTERREE